MKPDIVIRELYPEDHDRLVDIALAAWVPIFASFRQILGAELFALVHPHWEEDKAGQIRRVCEPDSPGTVLVAQSGTVVAGFVSFFPDAPRPGMAEIGNNAVHPGFQGQGIAQMMYREVIEQLRAAGMSYIKVCTGGDPSHLPARKAYEKAGFDISLPGVEYFRRL